MKKKVFRERYSLALDENAGIINVPKIDIKDVKDYRKKEPAKKGKKNVKSDK